MNQQEMDAYYERLDALPIAVYVEDIQEAYWQRNLTELDMRIPRRHVSMHEIRGR